MRYLRGDRAENKFGIAIPKQDMLAGAINKLGIVLNDLAIQTGGLLADDVGASKAVNRLPLEFAIALTDPRAPVLNVDA